jgi:transposase
MPNNRKPYPSDVSDEEWAFVAPYLALVREDAPQRTHELREVFDALRVMVISAHVLLLKIGALLGHEHS